MKSQEKKKFVPLKKQSKKEQKAYHLKQRKTWQALSPVERVSDDHRKFSRSRTKEETIKLIKET